MSLHLAQRLLCLYRSLSRSQAGDGHAVGGAGDVVEPDLVAEGHTGGIAAVLAANAELDPIARRSPTLDGKLHELTNAIDIEADEGIAGEDALLDISGEEASGIVAAHA